MAGAGELRERVVVQSPSVSASTQSGHGTVSYSTLDTVWAKVTPTGGTETLESGSVTSRVDARVEVRYRTDLTPKMRVLWTPRGGSAKTLQVLAVLPQVPTVGRLTLVCQELA